MSSATRKISGEPVERHGTKIFPAALKNHIPGTRYIIKRVSPQARSFSTFSYYDIVHVIK